MTDMVVFPKYGRMVALTFASFIFVGLGIIFLVVSFIDEFDLLLAVIGVITTFFFGFSSLYLIKSLIIRKPALILSDDGITDQSSYIAAGFLKWEEIMEFQFYHYGSQPFLGISTFDPQLILQRSSGFKKLLNNMNKGLVEVQANIPIKNLACDHEVLANEIAIRWEAKMAQYTEEEIESFAKHRDLQDLDSLN